jgi:uncharacterized protein YkwD
MVDTVRRLAPVALCLALALPASGAPVPSVGGPFDGDPVRELLASLNDARREAGLRPLLAEPALAQVATRRVAEVARSGDFDAGPTTVMALSSDLRGAGYPPYAWRQRLVQGPRDAASLVRQWKSSDPDGFAAVVLGDFEGFGAALAPGIEPPLWSLFVALPRLTWERREAAPLDDLAAMRAAVLAALNRERAAAGRAPLALDPRLDHAAQAHAVDMLERRFYAHTTPEGRSLARRLDDSGYRYRWAAENIAKGVFAAGEVVERWMLSSGHRRNILDPHPVHVGIGIVRGEEHGHVTALWVLNFGAPG